MVNTNDLFASLCDKLEDKHVHKYYADSCNLHRQKQFT